MENYQSYQMEISGFAWTSEPGSPGFRNRAGGGDPWQNQPPAAPPITSIITESLYHSVLSVLVRLT